MVDFPLAAIRLLLTFAVAMLFRLNRNLPPFIIGSS